MSRRLRFLDTARRLLEHQAYSGGQRHCAVCFRGSRLVSVGFNSYVRTHPVQSAFAGRTSKRNYLHAEIDALLRSKGLATTLTVVRINKRGQLVPSRPCSICQAAINSYGIKEVIHS
jgi:deoxycytidylate deaminase